MLCRNNNNNNNNSWPQTVPPSLHLSLSTPCGRNILPPLQLLLICQLCIRSSAYSVREPEVRQAVFFISYWLSGRPRHWSCFHHLLLSLEAGPEFLSALTAFVNLVLAGHFPSNVAPVFFGGRLLALSKNSRGFRPTFIGFALRRLTSKCTSSFGINHPKAYFYPHKIGVVTPSGCEAAVHSTPRYLESLPSDHVLVKLDFANVFNSFHRREMRLLVYSRIPELYPYCQACFSAHILFFLGSVPNKGTILVLCSSATPFTQRCLHWNPVWTSDILMISLWVAQRREWPLMRNYQGRCSNRTFTERGQVWAHY